MEVSQIPSTPRKFALSGKAASTVCLPAVKPRLNGDLLGESLLSEGQHAIHLTVENTAGKTHTASVNINGPSKQRLTPSNHSP